MIQHNGINLVALWHRQHLRLFTTRPKKFAGMDQIMKPKAKLERYFEVTTTLKKHLLVS